MKAHEQAIVDQVVRALSASDRVAIQQQLSRIERIQRSAADRMVAFHFEGGADSALLENAATDHCLARVTFRTAEGTNTAYLMSHRGRLSSLEFERSPRGATQMRIDGVALHADDSGVAVGLDVEEHGEGKPNTGHAGGRA